MGEHVLEIENVIEFDLSGLTWTRRLSVCLTVLAGSILRLRSPRLTFYVEDDTASSEGEP
ncbi:MAG: hypothetical protein WC107_06130 [Patescibacteria group bacterium]